MSSVSVVQAGDHVTVVINGRVSAAQSATEETWALVIKCLARA